MQVREVIWGPGGLQGKSGQRCAGKGTGKAERGRDRGQDIGESLSDRGSGPPSRGDICKSCVNPLLNAGCLGNPSDKALASEQG